MFRFGIPLTGIFAAQSLLVMGAFVAVILVLTEQQRTEFQDALYTRLRMQEERAMQLVYAPLDARQLMYRSYANEYVRLGQAGQRPVPSDAATIDNAMPFYDFMSPILRDDPLIISVDLLNRSEIAAPNTGGRLYYAFYHADPTKMAIGFNGTLYGCLGRVPVNTSACRRIAAPQDSVVFGSRTDLANYPRWKYFWGPPKYVYDSIKREHYLQKAFIVQIAKDNYGIQQVLYFSTAIPHLNPVVRAATASTASHAALFGYYNRVDFRGFFLISSTLPLNITERVQQATTPARATWEGGHTGDADLDAAYRAANAVCYRGFNLSTPPGSPLIVVPSPTDSYAVATANPCRSPVVLEEGGFVIAAVRLVTDDYLDLLLIQYTPRDYFYGASDRARLQGILIGAAAAVVVVITCVLVLFAIWVPVRALRRGMDLAAEMRNDEVPRLRPVLLEIAALATAFAAMNRKLLLARPFLPPSLLVGRAEEDEGWADEAAAALGEDSEGDASVCSVAAMVRLLPADGHGSSTPASGAASPANDRRSRSGAPDAASKRSRSSAHSVDTVMLAAAAAATTSMTTMTQRRVGVLAINMRRFHACLGPIGSARLCDVHRRLAALVERCVGRERGIIDSFHGDRFVGAFNTARPCGVPAKLAGLAALALEADFSADAELSGAFPLGLSMGLSTGRALVGNMGTATMQRLSTVGAVYSEAAGLQEIMARRVLGRPAGCELSVLSLLPAPPGRCLLSGRAAPELHGHAHYLLVGAVPAQCLMSSAAGAVEKGAEGVAAFAAAENRHMCSHLTMPETASLRRPSHVSTPSEAEAHGPVVLVASLQRRVAEGGGDEWLYSLQAAEQGDEFGPFNAALAALVLHGTGPLVDAPSQPATMEPASEKDFQSEAMHASVATAASALAAAATECTAASRRALFILYK